MSNPTCLTPHQRAAVRAWLAAPPVYLGPNHDPADFPRQLDTFVFDMADPEMRRKWSWSKEPLDGGRAFEMIHSSNVVLRALLAGHDPNGIFGPPVRQKAVDPNQLKLPYHDYLALMLELRDIVQDLEPDLQFACDKLELVQRGPVARQCGCERCRVPLSVLHAGQD